ncbi:RNB-like protein [Synechococcus sp. PCC 7335]|uniref:ribonuclease catalytic domain-containing protein n=1 Tax=Synechococcus sp. (strain ATCC 29403 / PCC 7335) TaxID=91464 RepID=UPI00017EDC56|nr:ribonuclease R family protein [Synechococcus sp. PCC 7335]EDX86422.1 RNB-like protein [Synechococcus sp. PCC 7335]
MEKGTLIEFKLKGSPYLAVADRPEGKKNWVLVDQAGQSHTIHPRQIIYEVSDASYEPTEIEEFTTEAQSYIDPDNLEVAWELLLELEEPATPASLAQLLFSDQSPPLCYAAHRLLSEDKIFFKQKGDHYEPRSASQVEELQHKIAREAANQVEREGFLARVQAALSGESVEWEKSDRPRLEIVERYALLGDESSQKSAAQELLTELNQDKSPEAAFDFLVALGLWDQHENLALRRRQIPTQFPEEVSASVAQIIESPPAEEGDRVDLTHLKVYTIDDESTQEIDDGLSCETLADGRQKLWIHIADPTYWISLNGILDTEARRRCTTVYLPTGVIPMFPFELAAGPMSLVQGQICNALSFSVLLAEDGSVAEYSIQPSVVKPTYRLTYDDADEMIELGVQAESELLALFDHAKQRLSWRKSQGAIDIQLPESVIKVDDDVITIDILESSNSREMVAEMMILTGEIAARYGEDNKIPLPFRAQPQPELPPEEELMQLEAGWVRDSAIRRCMTRSEMNITPARHATLGLDRYCQVTSPIRRYTDLMGHFQIKAHLRGADLPFTPVEMPEIIASVSNAAYEAVMVERQTKKYWAIEYLKRQNEANPGQPWDVIMVRWLREHESLGLIIFEDLGLEFVMRFDRAVEVGERLTIQVSYADPRQEMIRFKEVAIATNQEETVIEESAS